MNNVTMNLRNGEVNLVTTQKAQKIFRAINHKLRQQIIGLIDSQAGITVTELYVRLRLEQSVASQQLGILRSAGIVKTVKDGKFVAYSVNHSTLDAINTLATQLVEASKK